MAEMKLLHAKRTAFVFVWRRRPGPSVEAEDERTGRGGAVVVVVAAGGGARSGGDQFDVQRNVAVRDAAESSQSIRLDVVVVVFFCFIRIFLRPALSLACDKLVYAHHSYFVFNFRFISPPSLPLAASERITWLSCGRGHCIERFPLSLSLSLSLGTNKMETQ